ncbi:hypothetical protein HGB07_03605 [Candidatus Roizmanbacteria bacterium]|nr:hypothetical protein [Candidatus Roizmanbacteria bacterium]
MGERNTVKAKILTWSVSLLLCTLTIIYAYVWTIHVLARVDNTSQYIRTFEKGISTQLSGHLLANSLVLFSFTPPNYLLIDYMRPYDYLQWNHAIIGYFQGGYVRKLPENIHPMPLDKPYLTDLESLNITLTGSYWVTYGNNVEGYERLIKKLNILNIYHFNYNGVFLNQEQIRNFYVYDQLYTNTLALPILEGQAVIR